MQADPDGSLVAVLYSDGVSEQRIWTADELLAKSPDERADIVRQGFVKDPSLCVT